MHTRTILLEADELAALRRLVARLDDPSEALRGGDPGLAPDPRRAARVTLALRRTRARFLHRAMLGEPAFDMLLALYAEAGDGPGLTAARLAELSGVPQSSGLRWLNYLSSKQLVSKDQHPTDRRAMLIRLTDHGTEVLDAMFAAMREEFASSLAEGAR